MELRVCDEPHAAAADSIARRLRDAMRRRRRASLAVSGGSTAPMVFEALAEHHVDWTSVVVWQVDERVAADGDLDRNATQLRPFVDWGAQVRTMAVTATDLARAARRYERSLPDRLDVVHLGIGDDGHTASWPPAPHPDAGVVDLVAGVGIVRDFNGRDRLTLTAGPVNRARGRVFVATGPQKAPMVARVVTGAGTEGDRSIPAQRVRRSDTVVFADPAAGGASPH